jgi:uncharacterized protein (TIGR02271 family)
MTTRATQIQTGWDVYGSDDEKIGDVSGVANDHFIIEKGFIFMTDVYVPMSAIASVGNERVYLTYTKDQVENQEWSSPPAGDGDAYETDRATERDHAATGTDRDTIERSEERLTVDKQREQSGSVRVGKHVVEEEQSVDVPVTREEVHMERRSVDRPASGEAISEDSVDVPVYEEHVEVGKEARVVEELEVGKTAETDTKRVSDTVRREEFDIEDDSGTTQKNRKTHENR